jgi:hypothetical protein
MNVYVAVPSKPDFSTQWSGTVASLIAIECSVYMSFTIVRDESQPGEVWSRVGRCGELPRACELRGRAIKIRDFHTLWRVDRGQLWAWSQQNLAFVHVSRLCATNHSRARSGRVGRCPELPRKCSWAIKIRNFHSPASRSGTDVSMITIESSVYTYGMIVLQVMSGRSVSSTWTLSSRILLLQKLKLRNAGPCYAPGANQSIDLAECRRQYQIPGPVRWFNVAIHAAATFLVAQRITTQSAGHCWSYWCR